MRKSCTRLGLVRSPHLDERADDGQCQALQMIFSGQAGSWPARLVGTAGFEVRGMEFAPITVEIDEDPATWRAGAPGRLEARAEALTGPTTPDGARVQSTGLPGCETGPGQLATWGRATTDRPDCFGFAWNRSGKSSETITFDWSGPDRDHGRSGTIATSEGLLLGEHRSAMW